MHDLRSITVSTFDRIAKGEFTYFSPIDYPIGSFISVPYGKRSIKALVTGSELVSKSKSLIKRSDFSLKKIARQDAVTYLPDCYINAIKKVAHEHGSTVGACLLASTPKAVFDSVKKPLLPLHTKPTSSIVLGSREFALQDEFTNRIVALRSIIREAYGRNEPLVIVAPYKRHLSLLAKQLDIPETHILTASSGKKIVRQRAEEISNGERVVLLITPKLMVLASLNRTTIVLEQEGSQGYKDISRPFIDYRMIAQSIQNEVQGVLIRSDSVLETTTIHLYKNGTIKERYPVDFTLDGNAKISIVDMKSATYETYRSSDYSAIISPELERWIDTSVRERSSLILYTVRNGFQPVLLCSDCGERIIRSSYYDTVSRYKRGVFESSNRESTDAERIVDTCTKCGSWRLRPSAVAIEFVYNLLNEKWSGSVAMSHGRQLSSESEKILEDFEKGLFPILLTTEGALGSVTKKVDRSAVISCDSLLAIPDIGILEKTMRIFVRLHELSKKDLMIQTRNPSSDILRQFSSGTLLPLIRQELNDRKELDYPPFSQLIKITLSSSESSTGALINHIRTVFASFKKELYPSFMRGGSAQNIIVLIKTHTPEEREKALGALKQLPLGLAIDTTPVSLL